MPESFSRHHLDIHMEEDNTVLDVLSEIFETERAFYGIVRFLEGSTRNHIIAAHMRNTGSALQILRTFMDRPAAPPTMVMNIDLSGNMLRNFLDPVPVVPTREQIAAATETLVGVSGATCAICQEPVVSATRIRACGHCFHGQCIDQWLGMNTRCPVCRHDVREPLTRDNRVNNNENRGVHADE